MLQRRVRLIYACILSLAASIFSVAAARLRMPGLLALALLGRCALIQPALRIVLFLFRIPPGEQSVQIFAVAEILAQDSGGIRVRHHVLAKLLIVLEHVMIQPAEECNVA